MSIQIPSRQKLLTEIGKIKAIQELYNLIAEGVGGYNPPDGGIPLTDLSQDMQDWKSFVDTLIGGEDDLTSLIDTFEEVKNFLENVENTETLNGILAAFAQKTEAVLSEQVRNVVVCTQSQYDNLTTKDANTEYNIIESNA